VVAYITAYGKRNYTEHIKYAIISPTDENNDRNVVAYLQVIMSTSAAGSSPTYEGPSPSRRHISAAFYTKFR